ncbi:MAG: DJ-1/PfpI family protein [Verrucomicrobia bacterium]|nr:DJ-1/PfpI family protein [Verrucomicrobiota bacterium]
MSLASPVLPPKVLVPLAPGFEELEVVAPVDVLRRAGAEVTLAALEAKLAVRGRNGLTLVADTRWDALGKVTYDCVLLPGGPAVALLRRHVALLAWVRDQDAAGGWLAAICAAPTVLLDAGVLNGRRHTAHPSVAGELPRAELGEAVVVDGRLITSRGAGTALAFGLEVAARVVSPTQAATVRTAIAA